MSIRSVAAIAVKREMKVQKPQEGPPGDAVAVAAAGQLAAELPDTSGLTAVLPTEVVGLYTGVLAFLEGIAGKFPKDTYIPLRWALFAGGFALVALLVPLVQRRLRTQVGVTSKGSPGRALLIAMLAYGVWGLVTPGSAIYFVMSNPGLTVLVGVATIGGAAVVGLLQKYYLSE